MTPAKAIAAALDTSGVRTQRAQAAVLGELPQHWNRYLSAGRTPSAAKVQEWLTGAAKAGHPITLTWDASGARPPRRRALDLRGQCSPPRGMIEALTIMLKYGNPHSPTHCEHDVLTIVGIDPKEVGAADLARLKELGFHRENDPDDEDTDMDEYDAEDEDWFYSFKFGSA